MVKLSSKLRLKYMYKYISYFAGILVTLGAGIAQSV
jgi:hypothetical protein